MVRLGVGDPKPEKPAKTKAVAPPKKKAVKSGADKRNRSK